MSEQSQPTWDERVAELREQYDELRDKLDMGDVTEELGDVATEITDLPDAIADLREQGYAFAGYLERKASVLAEQWDAIRAQVRAMIDKEIERAQTQIDELERLWARLVSVDDEDRREKTYNLVQLAIENALAAVEGARERVEGLYGNVPENVAQTQSQINQIQRYLELAAAASVDWTPTEAVYMVNQGEWVQTGKDKQDPDGYLYLTDQRLIFEQNEKVGGRFGFGGEQVQEVLFAVPVGAISEVRAEKKGLLGGIDLIHLTLSEGDYAEITIEVKGGVAAEHYAQQLNRVIQGEIEKERAVEVDAAVEDAVQNAPTACTTCGATLPALVRGMTELTCDYCGTVVRI